MYSRHIINKNVLNVSIINIKSFDCFCIYLNKIVIKISTIQLGGYSPIVGEREA